MSGHSKWATIKRKKAATDQARGKLFSKCIKEITIAARHGGDPEMNPRLRTAITSAKAVSMPASNIERAIKRGTGEIDGANYEEMQYEGYGPGGVALLVEIATDNRNRTAGDIRHIFTKHGGNLGEAGSVAYLFKPRGVVLIDKSAIAEDALIELVLEAGADDVNTEGDTYEVLTPPNQLESVKQALAAKKIPVQSAEGTKLASLQVPVGEKEAEAVLKLVDALEDHDDVQKVYANFSAADDVLAKLSR
ncbi:MAG: YebC/PmpR family DNA-binding transcriptional regulator [Candidatus Eisenbacteria bacterium]|uniref:Probable transcriptional regulatory protein HY076_06310 n=1 Tax=Eiseniibacteriota bacterium TaxID=2212470 RepID=A0A9D6LAZ8_UNCEI|nr:YebC/PmpR family DNA-binding transcriptional regulator [Candidatus Eisenbacteria bacterium]MBI3539868.1 YebC/PmpR family DNA-binding transcriptional regulator [Candidatus Eisenbacteria bacterium]